MEAPFEQEHRVRKPLDEADQHMWLTERHRRRVLLPPGVGPDARAGALTLALEVYAGASGEILVRAVDPKEARDNGRMMWQTSVTNRAEADRMLRKWAVLLREALDRARAQEVPAAATSH